MRVRDAPIGLLIRLNNYESRITFVLRRFLLATGMLLLADADIKDFLDLLDLLDFWSLLGD